jgi:heat shock protein HslJ
MWLKLSLVAALVIAIILPFGACTTSTCINGEWQDIVWKLESYGPPENLQPVKGNAGINLEFSSDDMNLSGSGGCNHYFGTYTLNKNNCETMISNLGATEMACMDSALMLQEQKYFNLLAATSKIAVNDGELRLTCGNEVLVYTQ